MKFKHILLVTIGLACFSHNAFAEPELSPEQLTEIKKQADKGNVKFQTLLGALYFKGDYGVKKDPLEAKKWLEKAAENRNTAALTLLGIMYKQGNGIPQDYQKAMELFNKAADQDNDDAMFNIAIMYQDGNGVTKNYNKAMEWYKKSADKGNYLAMNNLGAMYEHGEGSPKDLTKAKEYYKQACVSYKDSKSCGNYNRLSK